jgi:hypothetical protein
MVLDLIVAVTAGVPVSTLVALDLDIALVVLTAQHELLIGMVVFLVLVLMVCDCPIRRTGVAWTKSVRVLEVDV